MICRHGILGRRSRERRVAATKVARPRGKKEGERRRVFEIGVSAGSKARNEKLDRPGQARLTWRNGWSPFVHFGPPPLLFISL